MLNDQHLGYTLFADKPVSIASQFTITPIQNTRKGKCGGVYWNWWKTWEKYEQYFPITNYILIKESYTIHHHTSEIVLINKKAFLDKVNQHIDIFKNFLGNTLTPEGLLNQVEKEGKFMSAIKANITLLGILLGYGMHNSQIFDRRHQLRQFISMETLPNLPMRQSLPSEDFSSIQEEYNYLHALLKPFGGAQLLTGRHAKSPLRSRSGKSGNKSSKRKISTTSQ